jgi:hypothetical protein
VNKTTKLLLKNNAGGLDFTEPLNTKGFSVPKTAKLLTERGRLSVVSGFPNLGKCFPEALI